ncbi:hypothetical protein NEIRO03_2456 [Nematocida sp. AWRm78]|nr:hypothetical protein NEIRO02_2440 [Nematocida sp. AWRm79]KAI5187117.1 hypothetical protein NEIRO03_2456 [Nematocida sp. AWRm78]
MNSNKEYLIQELSQTLADRSITPNKCDTVTKVLPIILEIFTRERITDKSHKSLELITYNTLCYMLDKYLLEITNCTDDNIITAVESAVNKTEEVINIIKNTEKEIPEKEKVKFFNLINSNHLFLLQGGLLRQIIQADIRKALKPELTRNSVNKTTALKELFNKTKSGEVKLIRLIELLTENNGKFTEYINAGKVLKHNTHNVISNEDIEILNLFLCVDLNALYNTICVIRNAYKFKNFNGKSNQKFLLFFDNLFFFWSDSMREGIKEEITRHNPKLIYDIITNTTGTIYTAEISKQISNYCISMGISQGKFNNMINKYKDSIITRYNPKSESKSSALSKFKSGVSAITQATRNTTDKINDKINYTMMNYTLTAVKTVKEAKGIIKKAITPKEKAIGQAQVEAVEPVEEGEEAIDLIAEAADTIESIITQVEAEAIAEAAEQARVEAEAAEQARVEAVERARVEAAERARAEAEAAERERAEAEAEAAERERLEAAERARAAEQARSVAGSVDRGYASIKNKLRNIILCVISIIIITILSVLCVIYSGGISRYITQCIKYFNNIIHKLSNKINNTMGIKSSLDKIIEEITNEVTNLFN